jgi:hypothetical protein
VRVRGLVVSAAAALAVGLLAGCGGGGSGSATPSTTARPRPGSIAAILARPGANVTAVPGDASFVPGPIRLSFLVIGGDGSPVERPTARVWVATDEDAVPFARTTAKLEPIGVPGASGPASLGETRIYVAHFLAPRVGIYTVVVEPVGGRPVQAELHIQVTATTAAPEVGARAIASRTPTIASTHGDFARLTTRTPPDRALLRYSVADSITARKPFVLVFATPKFCTSRTCGPVVDVVEAVAMRFAGRSGIRFIHVEVYRDNDPGKGFNTWFKQWHLTTEPWTFLVGGDGRIKQRFEGSVSVGELAAAVSSLLAKEPGTGR